MPADHAAKAFEAAIEHHLLTVSGRKQGPVLVFLSRALILMAVTSKIDAHGLGYLSDALA